MLALSLIGASFVSLVAAFFFRDKPSERDLADNEKLKSLLWLPNGVLMVIAAFYALRRVGDTPPRVSVFAILILVCLCFGVAGCVALVGFGGSSTQVNHG